VTDHVAGGDLPLDVCRDRPERQAAFQQAKADHDFNEQELELKTNAELTRAIHALTTELHRRLLDEPTR
jgi:hypothetical protein